MSRYAEQNLGSDEQIIQKAKFNPLTAILFWIMSVIFLIITIIAGVNTTPSASYGYYSSGYFAFATTMFIIFFTLTIWCFIWAIGKTIALLTNELAVTNKKIIAKYGMFNVRAMDIPLNKVQSVAVSSGFLGTLFNYGNIYISTAASGVFSQPRSGSVIGCQYLKAIIMEQIDIYEKSETQALVNELANAIKYGSTSTPVSSSQNIPAARPQKQPSKICPHCRTVNDAQTTFCRACGLKF